MKSPTNLQTKFISTSFDQTQAKYQNFYNKIITLALQFKSQPRGITKEYHITQSIHNSYGANETKIQQFHKASHLGINHQSNT